MNRCDWCHNAGVLLEATLDGYPLEELEGDIRRGRFELWEFPELASSLIPPYAVLEHQGDVLYVWAYAGERLVDGVDELARLARSRGCLYLGFRTQHRGLPRMLSALKPQWLRALGERHSEYRIEVCA
jgi:hypothetical protein